MDPVSLRAQVATGALRSKPAEGSGETGVPFSERIRQALVDTNTSVNDAEQKAREVAAGKGDVVETVIALSRAELSLRHLVTLRNRVFDAYQEIMRLQL